MPGETAPRNYHHGGLRQALIDAALDIAAEQGLDQVTVREAGRRAGVSSGAPFRHFPNKTALMTAVAEEAAQRLLAEATRALAESEARDALSRFRALGVGYLAWVTGNPTHFEIISSRRLIDFDGSATLVRLTEELRGMMVAILDEASRAGQLRAGPVETLVLQSRAFIYGLARMWVDGQFAQWGGSENSETLMRRAVDDYVERLGR